MKNKRISWRGMVWMIAVIAVLGMIYYRIKPFFSPYRNMFIITSESYPIVEMGLSSDKLGGYVVGEVWNGFLPYSYYFWFPDYAVSIYREDARETIEDKDFAIKYEIAVHNLEDGTLAYKIDVLKKLRDMGMREQIRIRSIALAELEGEVFWIMETVPRYGETETEVGINIVTKEARILERASWKMQPNYDVVDGKKVYRVKIDFQSDKLPESGHKLYDMFPELEKYKDKLEPYYICIDIRKGEENKEIIRYFAEER